MIDHLENKWKSLDEEFKEPVQHNDHDNYDKKQYTFHFLYLYPVSIKSPKVKVNNFSQR